MAYAKLATSSRPRSAARLSLVRLASAPANRNGLALERISWKEAQRGDPQHDHSGVSVHAKRGQSRAMVAQDYHRVCGGNQCRNAHNPAKHVGCAVAD